MPCFVHCFPVSAVQKLSKSVQIWQSCIKCTLLRFTNHGKNVGFNFLQVRCAHKSGDVINFIVACRISSRLKWYKNYKNWLKLSKVSSKNKMSPFYGSLCSIEISPTPPLISTGGQKVRNFGVVFNITQLWAAPVWKCSRDIQTQKQISCVRMIALCFRQVWWSGSTHPWKPFVSRAPPLKERNFCPNFVTIWKIDASSFSTRRLVGGERPIYLKIWVKLTHLIQKRRLPIDIR